MLELMDDVMVEVVIGLGIGLCALCWMFIAFLMLASMAEVWNEFWNDRRQYRSDLHAKKPMSEQLIGKIGGNINEMLDSKGGEK